MVIKALGTLLFTLSYLKLTPMPGFVVGVDPTDTALANAGLAAVRSRMFRFGTAPEVRTVGRLTT
jgi:hypothetical protein